MKFDPHSSHNPNFDEKEWEYYQDHKSTLELMAEIKSITDQDLAAIVQNNALAELSFDVRANSGIYSAIWLQQSWSPVWAGIAICMMIHGKMEIGEETTKFIKSSVDNDPIFGDNLKFVKVRNSNYLQPAPVRQGIKLPDLPIQGSLFDM